MEEDFYLFLGMDRRRRDDATQVGDKRKERWANQMLPLKMLNKELS
jgi:hypothetical protein